MQIEYFVLACGVEHGRLRAALPEDDSLLRPVLRVRSAADGAGYLELNTAVTHGGLRGCHPLQVRGACCVRFSRG